MTAAHAFKPLQEPRPDWVRELYSAASVCACVQCGIVLAGTGVWWLKSCVPASVREGAA